MKIELVIALLVLLASATVFGQRDGDKGRQPGRGTDRKPIDLVDDTNDDTFKRPGMHDERRPTDTKPSTRIGDGKTSVTVTTEKKPSASGHEAEKTSVTITTEKKPSGGDGEKTKVTITTDTKPSGNKPNPEPRPSKPDHIKPEEPRPDETVLVDEPKFETLPPVRPLPSIPLSENAVRITGNILLQKNRPSIVDTVQYDLDGAMLVNSVRPSIKLPQTFTSDMIAKGSIVTLYVSTTKTFDRKLAFAQYPVDLRRSYFPIPFDLTIELPKQQHGLLQRGDITLHFFAYITHLQTRMETFIPAGTSQILLQGTIRLVQKLDVYIKPNGLEINGLLRGRFGERYIQPGTSFQIFIISEEMLSVYRTRSKFESVAELTITSVPAMYPVPFSILVPHQSIKLNMKYYAIGYVTENGVRRLINQEPIWVVNEQKVLVSTQIVFNIIPSTFILVGTVTRSMPGVYFIQPRSSLILRLREVGTEAHDIIFKLTDVTRFPQRFRINISKSPRFDPSKNYDMSAFLTDENNKIYMASLQPIPLGDDMSNLVIPVDDLVYNVQVRLQSSSSNQQLSYIPGSRAVVLVTESPESPTEPIVTDSFDVIPATFREFSVQIPATSIQRSRNYYLVMMIELNGIITHVSKILLISNNQPPPLVIHLPVLSHNLLRGSIVDVDNRRSQWSSASYANLYLLDDKSEHPDKAIVQVWKIHLENDFPVRFEVQLDFSRLRPDRPYRLQAAIENGRGLLEYKPAGSVLALHPNGRIAGDIRVPVQNVKTSQLVRGLIYMNGIERPLPEKSEIIVQLSSTPSLTSPRIIDEIRIKGEGRSTPIEFTMNLPLAKVNPRSIYYFLVQYVVRGNVIIPSTQAFAFSPLNEATIILTIAKTPQIPITGQVSSTGSPLSLPIGSTLHLYVTDGTDSRRSLIISEVYLQASVNSIYEFRMYIDSIILNKKTPLYLHGEILYKGAVILSMPRPALLQITSGGEWNINLIIDLPTLLVGKIVSLSKTEISAGEFEVYVQITTSSSQNVIHTSRLRLDANFPQDFRVELDSGLFFEHSSLQARAIIKNCREQILFESGSSVSVHVGLNVDVDLTVVLKNPQHLKELQTKTYDVAPTTLGLWSLSVAAINMEYENGPVITFGRDFVVERN